MQDSPAAEYNRRTSSDETPAVGSHSIEPRPPFPIARRSVDDFATMLPETLVAAH